MNANRPFDAKVVDVDQIYTGNRPQRHAFRRRPVQDGASKNRRLCGQPLRLSKKCACVVAFIRPSETRLRCFAIAIKRPRQVFQAA